MVATEKLIVLDRIRKYLEEGDQPEISWDNNSEVSSKTILEALKANPKHPIDYFYDWVFENNDTYIFGLEEDYIKEAVKEYQDEIEEELGMLEGTLDVEEFSSEIRDSVIDCISVDYNLKRLLRGDINIRIEMHSNYDCINSHWFESQSPYCMDSYFGDIVRILKLSPAKVKKMLVDKGLKVFGSWPKKDGSKALVSLEHLWVEMQNSSCGANMLTFIGTIDLYEFLTTYTPKSKVIIPKGNTCGLFSSMYGGGSVIEMELLRDFEADLGKAYDKSGYLGFFLKIDDRSDDYCIDHVYGPCQSFWDNEITIK